MENTQYELNSNLQNCYKKNLLLLIIGQTISVLGSSMTGFALSLYILDVTGSPTAFSTVLAFTVLPGVIVNIIAGVFVDRHNKKKIIVSSNLILAFVEIVFMFIFSSDIKSLIVFVCFVTLLSIFQAFFGLALNASIPNIVDKKNVAKANSAFQMIGAVIGIVGPIIGAITYKNIGMKSVLFIDGMSFIASAICCSFILFSFNSEKSELEKSKSYVENFKDVAIYLKKENTIAFFLIVGVLINFMYNPLLAVVIPYINYNIIKVTEVQLSIIRAAAALGAILGSIFVMTRKSSNALLKKFFILLGIQSLLIILWIFPTISIFDNSSKWIITMIFFALLLVYALLNIIQNIPVFTYFQMKVPEEIRGRIFAVMNTALGISTPLGMWLFGFLLKYFNWIYIPVFSGIVMLLICIIASKNNIYRSFIKNVEE